MSLEIRFDRAESYRFLPYKGFTMLLHRAYLLLPCNDKLDIPFTTDSTSVEAVVGLLWTASAHDGNGKSTHPLVFPRRRHFGSAFLIAVTTTPRHQPRSQSHQQSEGIGQSTHCYVLR